MRKDSRVSAVFIRSKRTGSIFLNEYISTYFTLVEIQSRYDKDLFYLYNKSLLVKIIISNKTDAAYLFYVTNESNSRLRIFETNDSLDKALYQGSINVKGTILFQNLTLSGVNYPLIIQRDLEHTDPSSATSLAYETFLGEYRDMLVEQARKKAEENKALMDYYNELRNLKKQMDSRTKDGTYSNDLAIFKSDQRLFNELAKKCGLNDSDVEFYKSMQIPRKELFGTGIEYDNNWIYSIIFSAFFIILYCLSRFIEGNQSLLGYGARTTMNEITSVGLLMTLYWANKPYDYTIPQFLSPFIVFIIFYILIRKIPLRSQT